MGPLPRLRRETASAPLVAALFATAAILISASTARACTCVASRSVQAQFARADAVLVGRAVAHTEFKPPVKHFHNLYEAAVEPPI